MYVTTLAEILWYLAAIMASFALISSVWVAYLNMKHRRVVDELETQVMGLLDDSLQILIPTAVLNHISANDVGNYEIKTEFTATREWAREKAPAKEVTYPEDLSKPLSEKSQMYRDFGNSSRSPMPPPASAETQAILDIALGRNDESTPLLVRTPMTRANIKVQNSKAKKSTRKAPKAKEVPVGQHTKEKIATVPPMKPSSAMTPPPYPPAETPNRTVATQEVHSDPGIVRKKGPDAGKGAKLSPAGVAASLTFLKPVGPVASSTTQVAGVAPSGTGPGVLGCQTPVLTTPPSKEEKGGTPPTPHQVANTPVIGNNQNSRRADKQDTQPSD